MSIDKDLIYPVFAVVCGLAAAVTDIRSRKIPNSLTGSALIAGLCLHLSLDGWRGLLSSLAAALIAGSIFLFFYVAGGMGAGDVKLIAAASALVGLGNTAPLLIFTTLAGGVMGLVLAAIHGRLLATLRNMLRLAVHHREEGLTPHPELNVSNPATLRLPYGIAIAAGCLLTLYTSTIRGFGL
ncbi:prepilin peptidase CpaA [Granulicella pectinivorans]|jgi:prepilin peptidase CpaA|uniref:Prepilin peptidase CpaA n=1 Tax=Granulicella pectinivorans TaxID=474950 RepID=A0A1I6MRJ6_9BACT|nr:A24 family peptidase [Granulicella pectinivorans]SFS18309.1 prepilin peptidase CpaA [Granulicella pectinivorans]